METGDETFDDIYISKDTGKVVGVMYEGQDYKLVPFSRNNSHLVSYQEASMQAKRLFVVAGNTAKVTELVDYIYGK